MKTIFKIILSSFILIFFSSNGLASAKNWMSEIPGNRIINQLIIPGTHQSVTNQINSNSQFPGDKNSVIPNWLQVISNLIPHSVLRKVAAAWGKSQPYSITQQLNSGVRYFDFHVCYKQPIGDDDDLFLCNGLVSQRLADALSEVASFTRENPSEFVIINISHTDGVDDIFKETSLVSLLEAMLDGDVIPNSLTPNATLSDIRKSHRHIILFMDPAYALERPVKPSLSNFVKNCLWHKSRIDEPGNQIQDVPTLKSFLDAQIALRSYTYQSSNQFMVLKSVRSFSTISVIDGILNKNKYPNTIQSYEKPINDMLGQWLKSDINQYGYHALNIITQDWFTDKSPLVALAMEYDSLPVDNKMTVENKHLLKQKILSLSQFYSH